MYFIFFFFIIWNKSKKPKQFLLIRQSYLGLITVIWLSKCGSSAKYYSKSTFPVPKKTKAGAQFVGMRLWYLTCRFYPQGGMFRHRFVGEAKDLPWYARPGTPKSRSVVGTFVFRTGIEPVPLPWKGSVLTASLTEHFGQDQTRSACRDQYFEDALRLQGVLTQYFTLSLQVCE